MHREEMQIQIQRKMMNMMMMTMMGGQVNYTTRRPNMMSDSFGDEKEEDGRKPAAKKNDEYGKVNGGAEC